jgi:transcriptional regulator with XRE-family HTH domain
VTSSDIAAIDPNAYNEALGRSIQVLRTNQGMSRRGLAERSQISYSYLSAIENGDKQPSSKILTLIAAAVGVRTHKLIAAAEERAAEGRLGPTEPDLSNADELDRILDLQEERHAARYAARLQRYPQKSDPTTEPPVSAYAASRPSVDRNATEELSELLSRLQPEDVSLVLEMARRLARRERS